MSKGPKGEKRPADVIGAAIKVAKIATGEVKEDIDDDGKSKAAVDALRLMNEIGFRHLPIVEEGHVCGIISLRDFIGAEFQLAGES